jgi:hypothetical protein
MPRVLFGKLPKVNFPKFEGENLKLWQSCCENYFEMYGVDSSVGSCLHDALAGITLVAFSQSS